MPDVEIRIAFARRRGGLLHGRFGNHNKFAILTSSLSGFADRNQLNERSFSPDLCQTDR